MIASRTGAAGDRLLCQLAWVAKLEGIRILLPLWRHPENLAGSGWRTGGNPHNATSGCTINHNLDTVKKIGSLLVGKYFKFKRKSYHQLFHSNEHSPINMKANTLYC